MSKMRRMFSLLLVVVTIFVLMSSFSMTVSAASTSYTKCIGYNWNVSSRNYGKSTYITKYYTINRNKWVTIKGYWEENKIGTLKNQVIPYSGGKKVKDLLRFDVHIIDPATEKVVNYWYCLKADSKFKVFSAVPGINAKKYTIKVTSYLANYRTYVDSDLAVVAARLKYKLHY